MTDTILTIIGTAIYIPFLVQLARTKWNKDQWTRQLVLVLLTLQASSLLHVPPVMYCSAVALLVALILHLVIARPTFRLTPLLICSVLYIAWFAVSLLWSANPVKGLRFIFDTGLPLIAFTILGSVFEVKQEEYTRCLRTCFQAALIFVTIGIGTWFVNCIELHMWPWQWSIMDKTFIGEWNVYRWVFRFNGGLHGYTHPSYNLLPLFAILSLAIRLRKQAQLPAWQWWFIWAGGLVLGLLSQSRMTLIYSLFIPAVYAIYMQRCAGKRWMITALVVIAGIAGTIYFYPSLECYGADANRAEIMEKAVNTIKTQPILGTGAGAMVPIEINSMPGCTHRPHNEWVADCMHAGIIAAILSLALYITAGVESIRKKRWEIGAWLVIFCIFSLLEPPLYIGKGLYLFCLICCVLSLPASSAADREACTD